MTDDGKTAMGELFWGVAQLKPGVKARGERRVYAIGGKDVPEPACFSAAREALEAAGFAVFAPCVVEQRWKSHRRPGYLGRGEERVRLPPSAYPLFPGYLFFGWSSFDDWAIARHADGVTDVLHRGGPNDPPSLVPAWKMAHLAAVGEAIDHTPRKAVAGAGFVEGQRVEVLSGPFQGMIAKILKFKGKKRMKAFLDLEALGGRQGFSLDLDVGELKSA